MEYIDKSRVPYLPNHQKFFDIDFFIAGVRKLFQSKGLNSNAFEETLELFSDTSQITSIDADVGFANKYVRVLNNHLPDSKFCLGSKKLLLGAVAFIIIHQISRIEINSNKRAVAISRSMILLSLIRKKIDSNFISSAFFQISSEEIISDLRKTTEKTLFMSYSITVVLKAFEIFHIDHEDLYSSLSSDASGWIWDLLENLFIGVILDLLFFSCPDTSFFVRDQKLINKLSRWAHIFLVMNSFLN